jgi:hypothetical protein
MRITRLPNWAKPDTNFTYYKMDGTQKAVWNGVLRYWTISETTAQEQEKWLADLACCVDVPRQATLRGLFK